MLFFYFFVLAKSKKYLLRCLDVQSQINSMAGDNKPATMALDVDGPMGKRDRFQPAILRLPKGSYAKVYIQNDPRDLAM